MDFQRKSLVAGVVSKQWFFKLEPRLSATAKLKCAKSFLEIDIIISRLLMCLAASSTENPKRSTLNFQPKRDKNKVFMNQPMCT